MARQISDFEKIVQQYADQIATEYGTSVCWVCLDGNKDELKQYPDMIVDYDIKDPVFNWGDPFTQKDIMFNQTLTNDSSRDSITRISRSEDKTDKFSWSITEGMKIGQTVMTKAGIDLGGISAGFQETTSFEFDLSSTQGGGDEVKKAWRIDQEIIQTCHTATDIIWLLDRNKNKATFIANIILSGNVAIWFNDRIDLNNKDGNDKHWLWFPGVASVVYKLNPTGFIAQGDKVIFRATGTISADVGLKSYLQIKEKPITVSTKLTSANVEESSDIKCKEYELDADGKILNLHKSAKD